MLNRKVCGACELRLAARCASHEISWNQTARLMRELDIEGVSRGSSCTPTRAVGQFTSVRVSERLDEIGAPPSIGTVPDCNDAVTGSFLTLLQLDVSNRDAGQRVATSARPRTQRGHRASGRSVLGWLGQELFGNLGRRRPVSDPILDHVEAQSLWRCWRHIDERQFAGCVNLPGCQVDTGDG